jgi:hypothetical protein
VLKAINRKLYKVILSENYTLGVSTFFASNILLLITGVIGFFGLTLTKNEYFGYCLHFTWFCGACNLIGGLVITIFLFYGGVVICHFFNIIYF